ncbi:unnamed protein product [Rotaria sordida]|uniref:Uncharacterized protein n=1 Tax=Rotaria sordida TaxID=392033 RepID=A0A818XN39_9BILA|nr:unnamed protein product [Rotaria sordida]CAF1343602.1 unnamed protein product [Rotaria sordida]CAF3739656.1 unnamed protein product [Rotaria sordida]
MTATRATTTISLPKNKTGLFAGDTIQEVKSIKNQPIIVSRQSHHTTSTNQLSISSEQKHSKIQQYYRVDRKNNTTNNFFLSKNVLRTGFRPSPIRRQKLHETNSSTHRDLKDSSPKQSFIPSRTSNKLRSEIDHLNNKLKIHGDVNKILRTQHNRDTLSTPRSALSYSTSNRISSACTNYLVDGSHQRYPSAITNNTIHTLISIPGTMDISSKSTQSLSGITESSPIINAEDNNQHEINHPITHAYQIPQQSNVGNEIIFPLNLSPSLLSNKSYSKRKDHRSKGTKSGSSPFYVMYFTNLTMQQQHSNNNNENDKRPLSISATAIRKEPINSRTSTSHSRRQSIRKHVNTPVNSNTYLTIDDNDSTPNTTSYYNNKRFSAKITEFENENSHLLKDILRTTSWNHLQV